MKNLVLYIFTVLIWGSTWLAIKFQLEVFPMVSVTYRFAVAALILLAYCKWKGLNLKFNLVDHFFLVLLGIFLFSLNYVAVYFAEIHLTSGLVALLFSSMVFFNAINGYFILRSPITFNMILGAIIGVAGIALVFQNEILSFKLSDNSLYGLILGFVSAFLASLGNITAEYNQRRQLPIVQGNAIGMAYGAILTAIITLISGENFTFPVSIPYVSSLLYLSVFGSIIAFGLYLTLVGRIGSGKAVYAMMLIPLVALVFSTIFEGYRWSGIAVIGLIMVMMGNVILLRTKSLLQNSKLEVKKSDHPRDIPGPSV